MDITSLRVLATVLAAIAMVAVAVWAFGPSRRQYFRDAAQMPFADDEKTADGNREKSETSHDSSGQRSAGDRE